MKRILASLFIGCLFFSCSSPHQLGTSGDDEYKNQDIDYQPSSFEEAWQWVDQNIQYKPDPAGGNKQTPEETYALRSGDCEDFALLLAYFAYTLNIKVNVVAGYLGGGSYHACCRYHNQLIEPQSYDNLVSDFWDDFNVTREYSYEEAYYSSDLRSVK